MRTIRYPVLPEQAGWTVEQLLRREGFSSRMLTALRKLPRGLQIGRAHV